MYNLICRGDRPRSPVGLFVLFVLFLYFTGDRDGRPYYLCFTGDRDGRPYKSSVSFADSSFQKEPFINYYPDRRKGGNCRHPLGDAIISHHQRIGA